MITFAGAKDRRNRMANEITIAANFTVSNGELTINRVGPTSVQVDQTNAGYKVLTQNIGTSAETVDTTDLTSEGYCYMKNLDTTNFIKYGPDSTGQVDFGKLKPGESALMRLFPGLVLKATADTAACDLLVVVLED